ncbi:MAG: hypothetical protein ACYDDI_00305 [Candidatus Acidiferrales bacterium]
MKRKEAAFLLLLTFAALLIHGYHPRAEDAEIYVSGIVKILHPAYYPFGREFFEANSHLTLFPNLIAWTVRLTHLSLDWTLFLWHFASIFLFLLACWRIAAKCFPTAPGRWCAVAMVAALLTLPVAGTALYLFDQYLNPRDLSIFSTLFAIDAAMEKRYLRMAAWLIFTAIIHPLMAVFSVAFILLLALVDRFAPVTTTSSVAFFPLGFLFKRPSPAYWQSLRGHRYYYLLRWEWFEWLGIVGPLALLWWFSGIARRSGRLPFARLARAVFFFGLIFFLAALVVTIPPQFEILDLYQPMRSLQLVYVFLVIFSGGLLGESLLKNKALRWLLLFVPLSAAMCFAQFQLFPGTQHIEWPGESPTNPWEQAFVWIRGNTPVDAIFALDPNYMALPGEDYEGFRAIAERSRLADANKDWSVSALYPGLSLADDCLAQTHAATGWKNFGVVDFERLKKTYGVTWVVLQQPGVSGLTCPYQNRSVRVCRVN